MFSNQTNSLTALKNSLQLAQVHNHRVMLVLVGCNESTDTSICELVKRSASQQTLSAPINDNQTEIQSSVNIMHVPDPHSNSDISDQINALLGTENKCLFFDAHDAFNERLFAACAGTVSAGGLLVLRTPPLDEWAVDEKSAEASNFINRFVRKIQYHKQHEHETSALDKGVSKNKICLLIAHTEPASDSAAPKLNWQTKQDAHVAQVLSDLLDKHQSTIVVQADRGRGKSALIGRAIKRLLSDNLGTGKQITITATRRSACHVLLQHACVPTENQGPIRFVPIDLAMNMKHDLLLVEEAGSISIPVLTKLTTLATDIIFATTVQGYEGAGRGFALRFSKQLNLLRPGWIKLQPNQPIRWAPNDPLEAFVNDALLLNTTLVPVSLTDKFSPDEAQLTQIDKQTLCTDDLLLEEIYALLVQAHYQTTPADLRHMLDQEQLLVFAQRTNNVLTGAALVALEGNIPIELHQDIVQKRRRLPDQILPQLLAQSTAEPNVLLLRYARIVRIAVHPTLQRRGFGTKLFKQLSIHLKPTYNQIGASFGADEQSLSYWLKLGLTPIHYGYKANPRSGLRSACLMAGGDVNATRAIEKGMCILHKNLLMLEKHSIETDQVRAQLIQATDKPSMDLSDIETRRLVTDFCQSNRSFIDTVGFIQQTMTNQTSETVQHHFVSLLQQREQLKPKHRQIAEQAIRDFLADKI